MLLTLANKSGRSRHCAVSVLLLATALLLAATAQSSAENHAGQSSTKSRVAQNGAENRVAQQQPAGTATQDSATELPQLFPKLSTESVMFEATVQSLNPIESPRPAQPRLTQAQAAAFLAQYPGVWEGTSSVQSVNGDFSTQVSVRIDYQWDKNDPQVLSGRAVFVVGQHMIYATSRSSYEDGELVSVIERDGQKQHYIGSIGDDGRSVTWREKDQPHSLQSYSRETFLPATTNAARQLEINGYEDYRNAGAILTQKTLLTLVEPR